MNRKQAEQYLDAHEVEAKIEYFHKDGATLYSILVDPTHLPTAGPRDSHEWAVQTHGPIRRTNVKNLMLAAPLVPLGCVMFRGRLLRADTWLAVPFLGNYLLEHFLHEAGQVAMWDDDVLRPIMDYWLMQPMPATPGLCPLSHPRSN